MLAADLLRIDPIMIQDRRLLQSESPSSSQEPASSTTAHRQHLRRRLGQTPSAGPDRSGWESLAQTTGGDASPWPSLDENGGGLTGTDDDRQDDRIDGLKRRLDQGASGLLSGLMHSLGSLLDEEPDGKNKSNQRTRQAPAVRGGDLGDVGADELPLVYLHPVDQHDTLTGIGLRYGCAVALICRANKLWPNDEPQLREVLAIPVSQSSVRAIEVGSDCRGGPSATADLLLMDSPDKLQPSARTSPSGTIATLAEPKSGEDIGWTEHSWVRLPNGMTVQVGRLTSPSGSGVISARQSPALLSLSLSSSPLQSGGRIAASGSSMAGSLSPVLEHQPARTGTHDVSRSSWDRGRSGRRNVPLTEAELRTFLGNPGVGSLDESAAPGASVDMVSHFLEQYLPSIAPPTAAVVDLVRLADHRSDRRAGHRPRASHSQTGPAGQRNRALSSVSAASAASHLSDPHSRPRAYRAYPAGSGSSTNNPPAGLAGFSSTAPVAKGLDWVRRMAEKAVKSVNAATKEPDNELALLSWLVRTSPDGSPSRQQQPAGGDGQTRPAAGAASGTGLSDELSSVKKRGGLNRPLIDVGTGQASWSDRSTGSPTPGRTAPHPAVLGQAGAGSRQTAAGSVWLEDLFDLVDDDDPSGHSPARSSR